MIATAKFAGWGAGHKQAMSSTFGHVQWLMMNGQDPPVPSNMVDLDPTVTDVVRLPGRPDHLPTTTPTTTRSPPTWCRGSSQILTEMGASRSSPCSRSRRTTSIPQPGPGGARRERGPGRSAPDPIGGLVNHQMGTMRMGADPDTSVVDPDQRFHGIPNLYAIDGSVFPTAGGYNPTLTIEALAWRAAERLARAQRGR